MRLATVALLVFACESFAAPKDAVVRIISHGISGTVVHTEQDRSFVLTCAHGFQGVDKQKAIVVDVPHYNPGARKVGTLLLKCDYKLDLALILVRAGPLPFVCPVAAANYRPSDSYLSVGYDRMANTQTVRAATVLAHNVGDTETRTKEQPWHGRSGGALIDAKAGRIVGVVGGYTLNPATGRFDSGSYGFYASHKAIYGFMWGRNPPATQPPTCSPQG